MYTRKTVILKLYAASVSFYTISFLSNLFHVSFVPANFFTYANTSRASDLLYLTDSSTYTYIYTYIVDVYFIIYVIQNILTFYQHCSETRFDRCYISKA